MSSTQEARSPARDASSFRDPNSFVVREGDRFVRRLNADGASPLRAFLASETYADLLQRGSIVAPESVEDGPDGGLTLVHAAIPNWTYPYEWTWSMLRDAALLHLEILLACAANGFTTSDASSFNVTFDGPRPVFIDHGSFVFREDGDPWWAYTEFCEHFLYPLLVASHTGADLQKLLRGGMGRVCLDDAFAFLRSHKRRKGVLKHVMLPHMAASRTDLSVDEAAEKSTAMTTTVYVNILRGLHDLIDGLGQNRASSTWSDYGERSHYSDSGLEAKGAFVDRVCAATSPNTVLDIGTNDGHFAEVAAKHATTVVAADGDALALDAYYLRGPAGNVVPTVYEATNPSPGLGWRSAERSGFNERIDCDLVLALAVLHHVSLSGNVPLPQIVEWLAEFGADLVVEFVHREDEKVQHLLQRKTRPDDFDYGLDAFLAAAATSFDLLERAELPGGTRTMLHLRRRAAS